MLYSLQCGWLGIIDCHILQCIFHFCLHFWTQIQIQEPKLTKTKIYLDFIFYCSNFYYFSSFYVNLMNRGTLDTLSCMIDYIKKKKESIKRKILHFMILLLKLS